MKKTILFLLSVILLSSMIVSLPIEDNEVAKPKRFVTKESRMNIFADLGIAAGDFGGFLTGIGFQYGLSPDFFLEALVEINFNPIDSYVTNTAFAFSTNGVYKFKMSDKLKLFIKGGFSSTSLTASYGGSSLTSDSQFGLNAGAGIEFPLDKKMGLRAGSTFKVIFDPGEALTYFTFCGSFYYNL